jgi:hypothetical protein
MAEAADAKLFGVPAIPRLRLGADPREKDIGGVDPVEAVKPMPQPSRLAPVLAGLLVALKLAEHITLTETASDPPAGRLGGEAVPIEIKYSRFAPVAQGAPVRGDLLGGADEDQGIVGGLEEVDHHIGRFEEILFPLVSYQGFLVKVN